MASKSMVFGALLAVVVVAALACSGESYSGACEAGQDCGPGPSSSTFFPTCAAGSCSCSKAGEVPCCPLGGSNCPYEMLRCIPEAECVEPPPPCVSDEDCPGPPDARCGVGICVDGECATDVWIGLAVPSQYPGDCKSTVCTAFGDAEVVTDLSDLPDDGNICTVDTCDGDTPVIAVLPDKTACMEHPKGLCWKGGCKECSEPLGAPFCPDGLQCEYDDCVPSVCVNNQKDAWAGETMTDCGGPLCEHCGIGELCAQGSDCIDGACINGKCTAPTHSDGAKNGDETGIDCGYPGGPPNACKDGDGCLAAENCESRVCYQGKCQAPTCTDATKNGTETGTDCGGGCSPC